MHVCASVRTCTRVPVSGCTCMRMCMCVPVHVCMHECVSACMCMRLCTCPCVGTFMCVRAYMSVHMQVEAHGCICVCRCMHACVWHACVRVCTCLCVGACVCIHAVGSHSACLCVHVCVHALCMPALCAGTCVPVRVCIGACVYEPVCVCMHTREWGSCADPFTSPSSGRAAHTVPTPPTSLHGTLAASPTNCLKPRPPFRPKLEANGRTSSRRRNIGAGVPPAAQSATYVWNAWTTPPTVPRGSAGPSRAALWAM